MNIRSVLSFLSIFFIFHYAIAQSQPAMNGAEIKLALKKLNTLGSVLYFAAHPDDENTRLISWLAKERLYRTGYLSLTRGDGGQNLIGTEQGEELGLIRTNELLAARQVDGGEQFFSRANDFGFSKTYDETFEFWGKENILADAVWVIRKFRPDVIITRFPPDERAGHGQHQASAILAIEAFKAAADPNRFPEQLTEVSVWQAKRLLWNTSNFSLGEGATSSDGFRMDIGDYNPLLGQSYGEIAAESRTNHKSQGFGAARQRGAITERFELLGGDLPQQTLLDGVETSWSRVAGSKKIQSLAAKLNADFDITHPEKSIDDLLALLPLVNQITDAHWKTVKSEELKQLILACGGIWFESYAAAPKFALGEQVPVRTAFIVRRPGIQAAVVGVRATGDGEISETPETTLLPYNELHEVSTVFHAAALTQPYWLNHPHGLGRFAIDRQTDVGYPQNPDGPATTVVLRINGKEIAFKRPIVYKYTHPVRGEVYEPLAISPRITANIGQRALVFNGDEPKTLQVIFTGHTQGSVSATASLRLPEGWRATPEQTSLQFALPDEEQAVQFTIYPGKTATLTDSVSVDLKYPDTGQEAQAFRVIDYTHIPKITWFPPAAARLSKVETGISAKRIGYLPGAGDLVPQALREIGLEVDLLNERDVTAEKLSQYDAIVTGVRLYNVNDRMRYMHPRLLEYVENGGTLVVQYNTTGGLSMDGIGPYPFTLTRNRVTDETATVTFLKPESRVLHFPNEITAADFEGWIQERGLYFVGEADERYQRPLRMADPGEQAYNGSLLVTPYGKGNFVYTSLSFFRQLPVGVPGAYRLFVNLLAKRN